MRLEKARRWGLIVLWGLATALWCGCESNATLFAALEERQANAVMAALAEAHIPASKRTDNEGRWTVSIPEAHFAEAVMLLERKGLPPRTYQGVGEVFRKTGMVSSPGEERIRFMDALAQDIAHTLSAIDGVTEARVHIVLPENDPFAKKTLPSSAAVAIRHRWNADTTDWEPLIKQLVKHSIEGLSAEQISVTLFRDAPPPLDHDTPPDDVMTREEVTVWMAVAGAGIAGSLLLLALAGITYRKATLKLKRDEDERNTSA